VLADPDFGPAPANSSGWSRLPATAEEGRTVSKLVQAELYEQAAATADVLTRAKGPRLVHIASHGYYSGASDAAVQTSGAAPAATRATGGLRSAIAGLPASREDAMLNSGIVLANANVSLRPDRTPPHPPQPVKATPMTATSSPRKQPSSDSEAPTMPPPISWSATTHCCFLHGRSIATEPPFSWTEIRAQSMAFDVAKLLALDIMKKTKCRHNGWAS
jgi:hypothetical protein